MLILNCQHIFLKRKPHTLIVMIVSQPSIFFNDVFTCFDLFGAGIVDVMVMTILVKGSL